MILEVTTRRTVHTFPVRGSVRGIAFFAVRRRLAILLAIGVIDKIMVIDIQTGSTLVSSPPLIGITCFTFSDNGDRVICAAKTGDLRSFHIFIPSFNWDDHPIRLETVHFMSLLRSGHLAVNAGGSIQLLESEYVRPPSTSLDPGIAHVFQLDNGKAIFGSSRDHKDVVLLDMETMKSVASYQVGTGEHDASFVPRLLCASIDQHIAVLCVRHLDGFALRLYTIGRAHPRWEKHSPWPVLFGTLSPDGEKLITVSRSEDPIGGHGENWELRVRGTMLDGRLLNYFPFIREGSPPSNVGFTSETQFYTEGRWMVPILP